MGSQHIHSKGVVHRDIKPQNVLIASDGTLKLTDFGLARKVDASATSHGVSGTLGYMPPEAFAGGRSAAVDIWASGVVATELSSSEGPTDFVRTEAQVQAHVHSHMYTHTHTCAHARPCTHARTHARACTHTVRMRA